MYSQLVNVDGMKFDDIPPPRPPKTDLIAFVVLFLALVLWCWLPR